MTDRPDGSDQASDHDVPIPYRERIGTYYQTLGYGAPYRWAHFAEAPFAPLKKPLGRKPDRADHHGGAVPAGQGRPGAGRGL